MAVEILIVDDDHIVGALSHELLTHAGFTAELVSDANVAYDAVRIHHPRAVLLDILMPGIDGLTICRAIKGDPDLKDTKVIMVSGKSFEVEKERAARFGADSFIEKPYDVRTFAKTVIGIVGQPEHPANRAAAATPKLSLNVKIWGCRGESPSEASSILTPCVSVQAGEHLFVFDAGTGIIPLGKELAASGRDTLWLLLSHFHPAHIQGLGGFAPARKQGVRLHIGGPNDPEKSLEDCVRRCFQSSFAADPSPLQAELKLFEFQANQYDILPGVRLRTLFANHPTNTLVYSLETLGRRVVYCPDSELYGEAATALQDYDELLGKFCRGADLLIHDARYAAPDHGPHKNRGHSSAESSASLAARFDVGHLVLFHMDASYGDEDLAKMEASAVEVIEEQGSKAKCELAREGLSIDL